MTESPMRPIADAIANVAGAVSECARQIGQNAANAPVAYFEGFVAGEVQRLRIMGQDAVADGVEALGQTLAGIMTEGQ
jgi:hypothetical protein